MADCSKAEDQQPKNSVTLQASLAPWGDAGVDVGRAQTTPELV